MEVREQIPLSSLTTFGVGGPARFVLSCESDEDVRDALAFARARHLPWKVLGEGSNVLASDDGFDGVIILPRIEGVTHTDTGPAVLLEAGAGVSWDALVKAAAVRGLWGLENLAGIPGTVGAAPVQNIGAYGSELKDAFSYLDAFDTEQGEVVRMGTKECTFGYRDSVFKKSQRYLVLKVAFSLSKNGSPNLAYQDLARAKDAGADFSSPQAVGEVVRAIRAKKFPDLSKEGTAGSFFKNPVITKEVYATLSAQHPGMPQYPAGDMVKVPLAFVLDRVLSMRGFRLGAARLFEAQPLVLVLDAGSAASDVEALAHLVEERVYDATGIRIEREVRMLT